MQIRAKVEKLSLDSRDEVLKKLGDKTTTLVAIFPLNDAMNYYYPGKKLSGGKR